MSLYEDLDVDVTATPEDIKAAHRRAVRRHHPDAGGDPAAFHRVQHAFNVLSDQRRRARYDETGAEDVMDPERLRAAQALTIVANKVNQLIGMPNVDPRYFDVVVGVIDMLQDDQRNVQSTIARVRQTQDRMRQFARRLKRTKKEGHDQIGPMLEAQLGQLELQAANLDEELKTVAAAIELAREYRYAVDKAQPMMNPTGGARTVPPIWGSAWT